MKTKKDAPLSCKVVGGKLVIEIGINTLAFSFENGEYNNPFDEKKNDYIRQNTVVDKVRFAEDVVNELKEESEDGTTPVHLLLDKAMENAVENGTEGISE